MWFWGLAENWISESNLLPYFTRSEQVLAILIPSTDTEVKYHDHIAHCLNIVYSIAARPPFLLAATAGALAAVETRTFCAPASVAPADAGVPTWPQTPILDRILHDDLESS